MQEVDDEEEEGDDDDDDDDSEVKEENGVLVLNDANFDSFTADKDTVLLEFYAPWWVCSLWYLLKCSMRWVPGASLAMCNPRKRAWEVVDFEVEIVACFYFFSHLPLLEWF